MERAYWYCHKCHQGTCHEGWGPVHPWQCTQCGALSSGNILLTQEIVKEPKAMIRSKHG